MRRRLTAVALLALGSCVCSPNVPPVLPVCAGCKGAPCADAGACLTGHCVDGVCCDQACDQACDRCNLAADPGTCASVVAGEPGAPSCAPYLCSGLGPSCPTQCSDDSACAATHYCLGAACLAKLDAGSPCARDGECSTGHCADGVCCDSACNAGCGACNAVGACSPLPRGPAPDAGCGRYLCSGASVGCPSACAVDAGDCGAGSFCNSAGVCVAQLPTGQGCARADECSSGFCADRVCCSVACDLACDRCDLAASAGACLPAPKGQPGAPACSPFLCGGDAGTCPTACAQNGDCAAGSACSGSACLADGDMDGTADVDDCAPADATRSTLRPCYRDSDADGFVSATATPTCSGAACPAGTQATAGTDCDDALATAYQVLMCSFGPDSDNDGFHAAPPGATCSGAGCPDGGSAQRDCDDDDARAHPGQLGYFTGARDGGGYDWDCDGAETKDPFWSCLTGYAGTAMCQATQYTGQRGWVGAIPGCGDAGSWRSCASWEGTCGTGIYWFGGCGTGCVYVDGGTTFSVEDTARVIGCR